MEGKAQNIAPQLAWHFEQAGNVRKNLSVFTISWTTSTSI